MHARVINVILSFSDLVSHQSQVTSMQYGSYHRIKLVGILGPQCNSLRDMMTMKK